YSGNTTVSGGVLRFSKPFTSGASVNVTGGTLQMAHSDATPFQNVLKTAAVTVTGGNIDLVDNKMIVTGGAAASSWNGSAYGGTTGRVEAGYGCWVQQGDGNVYVWTAALTPKPNPQMVDLMASQGK